MVNAVERLTHAALGALADSVCIALILIPADSQRSTCGCGSRNLVSELLHREIVGIDVGSYEINRS